MHSRFLRARLWLEHNGLFPRGKLSFFTLYVLALDLLLLVVEKVVGMFRSSPGTSLSGWIIFLTLLLMSLLARLIMIVLILFVPLVGLSPVLSAEMPFPLQTSLFVYLSISRTW